MTETKETPAAEATTPTATTPEASSAPPAAAEAAPAAATTPTEENGGTPTAENGGEANGDEKEEDKPEPPKEMRAIVLTGFGGLKGVKVLQKPEPSVQPGEVLIRVKAW